MYKTIIAGEHITMNLTFYKITVCQIITLFGNAALRFALPLYLLRRTDSAALFQILLFTAIQAHAPTGQTGRFMSLITVCACLTQPAGQAAFGLLYGRFAALPSAVLFAAAAASIFINLAASHIFKKTVSFTKS